VSTDKAGQVFQKITKQGFFLRVKIGFEQLSNQSFRRQIFGLKEIGILASQHLL